MSYILEALKKSEQERQIGHVPDLSIVQETPARAAPRWPRWLLAALLLNAFVLVFLAWRVWDARMSAAVSPEPPTAATVPAQPAAPAVAADAAETVPAASMPTESAVAAPSLPEPVSQMPPSAAPPASESMAVPQIESEAQPQLGPDLAPLPDVESSDPTAAVPRWEDLAPEQRAGLPVPSIDVHVFAQEPERRFVLINLRKYLQGDTLENGAVIEAILADGIVLSYQGQQYRVDRP